MSVFKCEMCGGNLLFNKGDTIAVCESCGTKQTVFYFDDSNKNSGNKFTIVQKPDYDVSIKELTENESFINDSRRLVFALGKDYKGNLVYGDLEEVQHLLITGVSGYGKTNCLRAILYSLLCKYDPNNLKFIIFDPKSVEFSDFNGFPHLLVPVVSNPKKSEGALSWLTTESLKRMKVFSDCGVRDIDAYNELAEKSDELNRMPDIVAIIDDFYQVYDESPKEIEESILRILQNGRTCGIHMVIASLQADKKFLPERIKNSIPSIISFALRTKAESKYVLDRSCAERLTTVGDMLYLPLGTSILKQVKCCFVNDSNVRELKELIAERASNNSIYDEEVNMQIERLIPRSEKPKSFNDDSDADEMLPKAIEVVVEAQEASTTIIQRKLKLGYARAARIVDELEARNIVGPYEGSKPRKVLITKQQWLEMNALSNDLIFDSSYLEEHKNENDYESDLFIKEIDEIIAKAGKQNVELSNESISNNETQQNVIVSQANSTNAQPIVQNATQNKATKKRKKKIILSFLIVTACLVFIISLINKSSKKQNDKLQESKYNEAIQMAENGEVVNAFELFRSLKNYKDSHEKAKGLFEQYKAEKNKNVKIGSNIFFGAYEQDNDLSNGKETIEWCVLDIQDEKALVISRYGLDCQQYNSENTDVTWETCSLRLWLNETFLNDAFASDEQNLILKSVVSADENPDYSTSPGSDTTDEVFLLSVKEVNNYFRSNSERQCQGTIYCFAQNAYKSSNGMCWWILRTPGQDSSKMTGIRNDGSVGTSGDDVNKPIYAIRPAMWIDYSELSE